MDINIFTGFGDILIEVALALIPLIIFFLFFQIFFLKLPTKKMKDVIKGLILAFLGLALFLQGVKVGFFPAGERMGESLGAVDHAWILIPLGFILGFVATFAEPAVRVLNHEVEKVSGGYIPQKVMLYTLSLGVALSIALSMFRILAGIPLWYFILPGYILVLVLIYFSKPNFVAIAFDSGGVATGPMTVTFILAISVGVASVTEGRDPLMDGFGMIALVALAPILTVLVLGLLYRRKERENERDLGREL
ncbi:hypothetical protein GCM10010965_00330 [Caldalkalibacillus thermarum]|uniref:DUF1538 domain-containing protein n=1 Tax=Caldalkalibacillus thermarum TaxID=296745 RepID=UPI001662DA6C|nr:DUF1538 domain-containing protein [Caldalkalibacillus thermarum]GGK11385.1 hypothetical protein GCM10010965_00330 [Caldalkalibacillus thermarum]